MPLSKNVICTIEKCTKEIVCNDSSTKIMWDHIKYHHKETYRQLISKKADEVQPSDSDKAL